jgi:hypothetical protein
MLKGVAGIFRGCRSIIHAAERAIAGCQFPIPGESEGFGNPRVPIMPDLCAEVLHANLGAESLPRRDPHTGGKASTRERTLCTSYLFLRTPGKPLKQKLSMMNRFILLVRCYTPSQSEPEPFVRLEEPHLPHLGDDFIDRLRKSKFNQKLDSQILESRKAARKMLRVTCSRL